MELSKLRETVTETNDEYWHQLVVGPYYHDRPFVEGDNYTGTSHSHYNRAVLHSDVNVSLEWGYEHETNEDGDYPWSDFPDKKVRSMFVDVFYAGSLVDRNVLYVVDGHRAILPNYRTVRTDDGGPFEFDSATWEHRDSKWEFLLAQLINQLSGNSEFASYFARSGLVRA